MDRFFLMKLAHRCWNLVRSKSETKPLRKTTQNFYSAGWTPSRQTQIGWTKRMSFMKTWDQDTRPYFPGEKVQPMNPLIQPRLRILVVLFLGREKGRAVWIFKQRRRGMGISLPYNRQWIWHRMVDSEWRGLILPFFCFKASGYRIAYNSFITLYPHSLSYFIHGSFPHLYRSIHLRRRSNIFNHLVFELKEIKNQHQKERRWRRMREAFK